MPIPHARWISRVQSTRRPGHGSLGRSLTPLLSSLPQVLRPACDRMSGNTSSGRSKVANRSISCLPCFRRSNDAPNSREL